MSLLPKNRAFLPACLTLGMLLCVLPILADSPVAPAAGAVQTQRLLLQHIVPTEILKTLHWDQAASLPAGVTQVIAQPETNALSIVATPAGFAKVREIIKALDIAPREVQIKLALAHTNAGDLNVTQPSASRLLQLLTSGGAVTQAPDITTSNNVEAIVCFYTTLPSQIVISDTYTVKPHINDDGSVTLALHIALVNGTAKREINATRTVKSGDASFFVVPPAAPNADGKNLLVFVTPTVLPDGTHATPKK